MPPEQSPSPGPRDADVSSVVPKAHEEVIRAALDRVKPPNRSWEARWTTAALFGAHVSRLRSSAGVSAEGLSLELQRSPRWILAAERGEILFTKRTVMALKF